VHRGDIVIETVAAEYLAPLKEAGVDTLILGCTHYPILLPTIRRYVPKGVSVVAQGSYIASSLHDYLHRHPEMETRCTKQGTVRYFTTERADKFQDHARIFLSDEVRAQHISLE